MIVVAGEAHDVDGTGGIPATVAVAIARLGQPVHVLGRLRDDPPPLRSPAHAVHAVSHALVRDSGATNLECLLRRERRRGAVTVSVDLKMRSGVVDLDGERARLTRQIRLAHIVKASAHDLDRLYPGVPAATVLASWQASGLPCGVVTHGSRGAYLVAPNGVAYRRVAPPVDVVDTTGAGDAFIGGLLAGLASLGALGDRPGDRLAAVLPQQWLSLLDFAGRVASITCTRSGAEPPTLDDIFAGSMAA